MTVARFGLFLACWLAFASQLTAQNVTGYGAMPDPLLFLLREPGVHQDLGLSATQLRQLVKLNQSFDQTLLAARNMEENSNAQQGNVQVFEKTRQAIGELLSAEQRQRLQQIAYRLRGMPFVLDPRASQALNLSDTQRQSLQDIIRSTQDKLKELQPATYPGPEKHEELQRQVAAARKKEQQDIIGILDEAQRRKLLELIGKNFDTSQLGHVSFKAPEVVDSGQWINTPGLKLADLRGQVVALHFFAFG